MKNPTFNILLISTMLIFFAACSNNSSPETQNPKPETQNPKLPSLPNESWAIPFESFQLQAEEAVEIQTPGGSLIKIPAGSLVDADGKPVRGKVELSYREFHSAADIFRSGIPMRYDSAGSSHILRSAGMFEMRAAQEGKPVFIAEGKEIELRMNSAKSGSYNFYKLNESGDNNWQYLKTASSESSNGEQGGFRDIPKAWIKPEKADNEAVIFDFKTNYQNYPELAEYKNVLWQDAGLSEDGVLKVAENEWIFGEAWEDVKVTRARTIGGTHYYFLALKNKGKKARLLVKPVLEGKAYRRAMQAYSQNEEERKRLQAQYAQQTQQAAAQAAANSFYSGIRTFGIYNWDLILKKGNLEVLAADFRLENGERPETVYLIIPDAPVAVKFTRDQWKEFTYSPHWKSMVVAVLPDDRLAILNDDELKAQLQRGAQSIFTLQKGRRVAFPGEIAQFFAP